MPNPRAFREVAAALGASVGLIEKDWHVVRAIGVLAALDHGDIRPVFSGGTSLSIGWGLIKRFSEDVDFKIAMPAASTNAAARARRRNFRDKILSALAAADLKPTAKPMVRNEGRFFAGDFAYPSEFETGPGLRPHLRMEMTFQAPTLAPIEHSIQSLVARVQKTAPEVVAFFCVDPVETAADKLSALAWRVCVRERGAANDDPTMIRHLHDLAALEQRALAAPAFAAVLRQAVAADASRGGGRAPRDPRQRFAMMLDRFRTDSVWASEYEKFVTRVSFAAPTEAISFETALTAVERLVAWFHKT